MTSAQERAVKKKKRRRSNLIIALSVALGVLLLIGAIIYPNRHSILNMIYAPDEEATSKPATYHKESGKNNEPSQKLPDTGEDKVYNFLVCGYDRVALLSDVNLLVSFNVSKLTASIMQIPRDTYVSYDGYWYHKANGVFSYMRINDSSNEDVQETLDGIGNGLDDQDLRGIAGFAAFLEDNLCVKIHYYAVMDLEQFANIVDALGGVDMYVPQEMHYEDPGQNLYIHMYPGYQTLNGKQSEQVVRFRATYGMGDIGRGNMQKLFMASLFKSVRDKTNLFNISDLCDIIEDNLVTNMTTSDMIYFVNNAMTVDLQYVSFMTLPGWFYNEDGVSYYSINKEAAKDFVNSYFNIYDEDVTDEQFDANGVFFNYSATYGAPAESLEFLYMYSAEQMTEGEFQPQT